MPWVDNPELDDVYVRWSWFPPSEAVNQAIDFAYSLPVHGVEYEDGQPVDMPYADIPIEPGRPFVRVYLGQADHQEWVHAITTRLREHGWPFTVDRVESHDWANAWKAYYQPQFLRGGYVVVPSWISPSPVDPDHTLWLDPGMAFGTGTHATTRMCANTLLALDLVGRTVLDVGAGSGILGLLAAKHGARRVVMVEPDRVAVDAMRHNVRVNGLASPVEVVFGTLGAIAAEPFDVLCLNIIWDIISAEWERVQSYLAPGAVLLVSGILPERRRDLLHLVSRTGQSVVRMIIEEGWMMAEVR